MYFSGSQSLRTKSGRPGLTLSMTFSKTLLAILINSIILKKGSCLLMSALNTMTIRVE